MNAGRKLDVMVAQKVFGLRVVKADHLDIWDHLCPAYTPSSVIISGLRRDEYVCMTDELAAAIKKGGCSAAHASIERVPAYSTDIEAAWEVAREVTRKCAGVTLHLRGGTMRMDSRNVDFQWQGPIDVLPWEICIAALKAVGVEVP